MLNKKNIAVAMAAATVAMPMTQSFAAVVENTQTEEIKAMKEKALELMNKKFTKNVNLLINTKGQYLNVAGENVFELSMTTGSTVTYNSYAEFERAFDKEYAKLEEGQSIKINYGYAQNDGSNDIGYSTLEDGTIVDFMPSKFTETALTDGSLAGTDVGQLKVTTAVDGTKKYEVRLSNDEDGFKRFQEVKVGELELDFTKPVLRTVNGYYVDINGDAIVAAKSSDLLTLVSGVPQINGTAVANAVVDGFYLKTTGNDAEVTTIVSDVITKKGFQEVSVDATEIFNAEEGRLTTEGNELFRKLQEMSYDLYDTNYTITSKESVEDKEVTILIEKKEKGTTKNAKVAEIKIARDAADKKGAAYTAIKELALNTDFNFANNDNVNVANKTITAAGADRYETAAEVSRRGFTSLTDGEIVLVTGAQDKLVDGLTATPLAAALNSGNGAPVLLTGNDKIAQPVLDEIERLNATKVYIVGGAISEDVEKELKTVHGLKVERVSGDDRYETSLAVAEKIVDLDGDGTITKATNVFVVGGKGEADALSVASAAARLKAPILLTNSEKLTKDVKYFLNDDKHDTSTAKTYVVGGTSSVSEAVYNEILDIQGKGNIKRLAGEGRQETNAAVIDEFFTGKTVAQGALQTSPAKATQVVVAKSDNKGMVDALGAGLYAGQMKDKSGSVVGAPVVLATNGLSEAQEDVLAKITVDSAASTDSLQERGTINKLQVGNGIAAAVAKFIKGL